MAFKPLQPPGTKIPFNEISHLNAETLKFVTALRAPGDEYFEWLNKLSPEERAAVEAQNKVSRKDRTCNRPECKNVFNSLSLQAIEKANAEKRIEELNSLINTVEENYSEVSEILNNLQNEGNDLMTRMEALRYKERKGFKDRQHAIMQQKTMFEQKIKATEKEIDAILGIKRKSTSNDDKSGINFAKPDDIDYNQRKHSGIYVISTGGQRTWSCCLSTDEDAPGCIDDCSVGIKSTLVLKNTLAYRPLQSYKKELKLNASVSNTLHNSSRVSSPNMKQRSIMSSGHSNNGHNPTTKTLRFPSNEGTKSRPSTATALPSVKSSLEHGHIHFGENTHTIMPAISTGRQTLKQHSHLHSLPLNSGSILLACNERVSRPSTVGKVRDSGELNIHRVGGRPCTSDRGPHLSYSSTVPPGNCLTHMTQRII